MPFWPPISAVGRRLFLLISPLFLQDVLRTLLVFHFPPRNEMHRSFVMLVEMTSAPRGCVLHVAKPGKKEGGVRGRGWEERTEEEEEEGVSPEIRIAGIPYHTHHRHPIQERRGARRTADMMRCCRQRRGGRGRREMLSAFSLSLSLSLPCAISLRVSDLPPLCSLERGGRDWRRLPPSVRPPSRSSSTHSCSPARSHALSDQEWPLNACFLACLLSWIGTRMDGSRTTSRWFRRRMICVCRPLESWTGRITPSISPEEVDRRCILPESQPARARPILAPRRSAHLVSPPRSPLLSPILFCRYCLRHQVWA